MAYRNVLMIDDDEDDQEIFTLAVESLNIEASCTTMTDAVEAINKLSNLLFKPDIIFLDLNMPVLNGEQFLIQIKKNTQLKEIPVVIYSTSSHAGTIQQMKELGAIDFIIKPDRYDKLVNILKPILA